MILACDTSSVICSVAIAAELEVVFAKTARGAQIHVEQLAPFLKAGLTYANLAKTPLTALALAIGPGSFNGLRIGLATMKALAYSLSLPLIPIPTPDGMAQAFQRRWTGLARCVIYSHRDFVHYADYHLVADKPIVTPEFHYGPWSELFSQEVTAYFGMADRGFQVWLEEAPAAEPIRARFHAIPADAGEVALLAIRRGLDQAVELDTLEPLYNAHYAARKWVPPVF